MSDRVMERIRRGARVGFFGLGRSNLSLISCLPLEKCRITLRSDKAISRDGIPKHKRIERIFDCESAYREINEDVLIFSPSVRRDRAELAEALALGVIFTSDAELFFEANERSIFAVSGSDGKSTTATLAHLLLESSLLIGNIGAPMTEALSRDSQCYVAELSSFMLTYAKVRAERACITNITPNHLDWHASFEEYRETKLSLLKNARECVINADDEICAEFARENGVFAAVSDRQTFAELKGCAELIVTRSEHGIERNGELLVPYSDIKCRESHNIKNLMTAIALSDGYADKARIVEVARSFSGLAHRCERFLVKDGVEYVNSSIDSSPARTVQTLESLGKRVILLLGGRSKGVSYETLAPAVKKYAEYALIFGENREEIYREIKDATKCEIYGDLESAAIRATELSHLADAVLFSPASTSYDAFRDFEERGNYFKKIIKM